MTESRLAQSRTDCNCSALREAARVVTRIYDEALAPVALGASQYAILAKLDRLGSLVLGDLANALVMDRSTVGHLLRPLEKRGLLIIAPGVGDGRRRVVTLSPAGQRLVVEACPLWAAAQLRFEQAFGTVEAEAMRSTLARVIAADRERASKARGGESTHG